MANKTTLCPCGSGKEYSDCCEKYLDGRAVVTDTPENILRSRYTAYRVGNGEYLLKSWHPDYRPKVTAKRLIQEGKNIIYTGLEILDKEIGDNSGKIHYVLKYRIGNQRYGTNECTSLFEKVDGVWYYTDDKR